jgi:hypothetical protein
VDDSAAPVRGVVGSVVEIYERAVTPHQLLVVADGRNTESNALLFNILVLRLAIDEQTGADGQLFFRGCSRGGGSGASAVVARGVSAIAVVVVLVVVLVVEQGDHLALRG